MISAFMLISADHGSRFEAACKNFFVIPIDQHRYLWFLLYLQQSSTQRDINRRLRNRQKRRVSDGSMLLI